MNEVERRLEAAFERYNLAALSGVEPTIALFIEALGAEGLRLSLKAEEASVGSTTPDQAGVSPPLRRRADDAPDPRPGLRRPARFRPGGSVG